MPFGPEFLESNEVYINSKLFRKRSRLHPKPSFIADHELLEQIQHSVELILEVVAGRCNAAQI